MDYIPGNIGSGSVESAIDAPPINNIYAEIIKESPEISGRFRPADGQSDRQYPYQSGDGSATQRLELDVKYEKSNVVTNGDIRNPLVLSGRGRDTEQPVRRPGFG